jgi:uncharacterized protein
MTHATQLVNIMCYLRFIVVLSFAAMIGWDCFGQDTPVEAVVNATPRLANAAEASDWSLVKNLASKTLDIDRAQADGMTALHWAVHHEHRASVARLIAAKANVNATTRYLITSLSIACESGNPKIVEQLLDAGAAIETTLAGGETTLMIASRTGNVEVIRSLVAHKAKLDATDKKGQTALMWAAAEGNANAVAELLKAGAKLNTATSSGFTAMMFAVREGRLNVARQLVAAGLDVNAVMKPKSKGPRVPRNGTSALTLAVESGHFELALYLVEQGADPNDQRSGFAPLHALSWIRKPDRGENSKGDPSPRGSGKIASLEFVTALVKAGANVNARLANGNAGRAVLNLKGATPFLMAAKTADVALMKVLLKEGAKPGITNIDGSTPLMAAAGVGVRAVGEEAGTEPEVIEALEFLLKIGAEVNVADKNKETAMHGAAYRNFPKVVAYLAKRGAIPSKWNHKNKYGWTPVMIAQGKRPGSFKPSPKTVDALMKASRVNE